MSALAAPSLVSVGTVPARVIAARKVPSSGLIGALFLLGFASYGTGFALVTSVVGLHDFLSTISAHRWSLAPF